MPELPITANLAAWYKYNSGIISASSLVSQWNDLSGNGRHLLQATATNQPTLMSDGSILLDGLDNFMQAAFTLNQPCTFYLIVEPITFTANAFLFDAVTSATMLCRQDDSGVSATLDIAAGVEFNQAITSFTLGACGVVSVVFNGASSLGQLNNNAPTSSNAGTNNSDGFTLGSIGAGSSNFSRIKVKEGLAYSVAHTATQREQMWQYLRLLLPPTDSPSYGKNRGTRFRRYSRRA